jgi:3-phenylpropionate/cinnamic acid dioxygenase small subunit
VETDDDRVTTADPVLDLTAATAFIWREAELLDLRDYDAWLALWTETGDYVIPVERGVADYAGALNIVYDNGAMRAARVKRLRSGLSMSANAAARTVRTVSRFVVASEGPGVIEIRCAQHIVEYKREQRMLAADVLYRIVTAGAGLALDLKIVTLIDSDEAQHGIGYLL